MLSRGNTYHQIFYEETGDQINELENLISLLYQPDFSEDNIDLMFRLAHSLKGSAAAMAISPVVDLTHRLESIFDLKRKHDICFTEMMVDMMLSIIDVLKKIHSNLFESTGDLFNIDVFLEEIDGFLPQFEEKKIIERDQIQGLTLLLEFNEDASMLCVKAYMIIELLKDHFTINETRPSDYENADDDDFNHQLVIGLDHQLNDQALKEILEPITDIKSVKWVENKIEEKAKPTPIQGSVDVQSVKVAVEQIDKMIQLTESLVILQEKMDYEINQLSSHLSKEHLLHPMKSHLEHLSDQIDIMRGLSVQTRMVPMALLFNKLPRYVNQLCREKHKEVKLNISGSESAIDKSLIEKLSDPINHLIRNAVDHGIETIEERLEKSKLAVGHIEISALQSQNQLVLEIKDDGRGVSLDQVRKKALVSQLISLEEAEYMTDKDWMDVIFLPGFSTKKQADDLSGRGVGLDVVQESIRRLNGSLELKTNETGTSFIIKVPLTLSIMDCFILKQDECLFGIPEAMILEVMTLTNEAFNEKSYKTDYDHLFLWQDHHIPYLDIKDAYHLYTTTDKKHHICVVSIGEYRMAIHAEQIIGKKSLVISSISYLTGKDTLIGERNDLLGLSTLGDESMVQVLDVSYWMNQKRGLYESNGSR